LSCEASRCLGPDAVEHDDEVATPELRVEGAVALDDVLQGRHENTDVSGGELAADARLSVGGGQQLVDAPFDSCPYLVERCGRQARAKDVTECAFGGLRFEDRFEEPGESSEPVGVECGGPEGADQRGMTWGRACAAVGSASSAATMRTMARGRVEGMAEPSRGPVDSRSRSGSAR